MQSVFSPTDLETYLAGSPLLDTPELVDVAVLQALALAESPKGANRSLSVVSYTEVHKIPRNGRVILRNLPLNEIISVQIRGGSSYLYGDFLSNGNVWKNVSPDSYQIDAERGEIAFYALGDANRNYQLHGAYARNPLSRPEPVSLRLSYKSGFDWCGNAPEINQLKASLAGLIQTISQSKAFTSGLKSFVVENFYEAEFDIESTNSVLDSYLSVFRKWRAR